MNETEVKRVQLNSARAAYQQAQMDYISSVDPDERLAIRSQEPDTQQILADASANIIVSELMLSSLQRTLDFHSVPAQTASLLESLASDNTDDLRKEIEDTKAQIRLEKRKFLDSNPQTTTSFGGIYFTGVPDNQALWTFLICYGSFWFFLGLMLLANQIPLPYISGMSSGDRLKLVGISWLLIVLVTYLAFFMFT